MDGFSDLNLFTLIARHRDLAAAARDLGVTPRSISKRLAQLERRLGVRLLNRTTRRVSLTPEASCLWRTARASSTNSPNWNNSSRKAERSRRVCCA
jgi:DNA-binding transcriptional LysR family regulator